MSRHLMAAWWKGARAVLAQRAVRWRTDGVTVPSIQFVVCTLAVIAKAGVRAQSDLYLTLEPEMPGRARADS